MTTCEICNDGKDYKNLAVHKRFKHEQNSGQSIPPSENAGTETAIPPAQNSGEALSNVLKGVVSSLETINNRLTTLEVRTGGLDLGFKRGVKQEDVASAEITRHGVDERIVKIVDEILGEDFGVEVIPREGQPGLNFTILVPKRVSDVPMSMRPVKNEDGTYQKQKIGEGREEVVMEDYWPGDKRTRAISGHQSYDAIREYCIRVRAYIIGHYQKLNKPIPEFKLRQY